MKETTKIVAIVVLAALLIISVGYAAIANVTLEIKGTAEAEANQANFTVKFIEAAGTTKSPDTATVTQSITGDKSATISVSDLTAKGDYVTATYKIQNTSPDLTATLTATTNNDNQEYFKVSYYFGDSETNTNPLVLTSAAIGTVTVKVELDKTPINDPAVTANVGLTISAAPSNPTNG